MTLAVTVFGAAPAGAVTFMLGAVFVACQNAALQPLNATSSRATCTVPVLPFGGLLPINIRYGGDAQNAPANLLASLAIAQPTAAVEVPFLANGHLVALGLLVLVLGAREIADRFRASR